MPDDVQPDQGQGSEGTGSPYDSYLQAVPEGAREAAEQWFRDTSKGLDAKLQEAAELKKTWEPYTQVEGLQAYPPEQLNELLAWHQQVTSSPDAFKEWVAETAKEVGITPAEAEDLSDAEATGELTREQIEQIIAERASERLQPLEQRLEEWEEQQQISSEENTIRDDFSQIEAEQKIHLSDEDKAEILDLGINYEGEGSWIQHGFDRFMRIGSRSQQAFVSDKSGQPEAALTAGGVPQFKPTTSFKEAGEQLKERLRQMQT